MNNMPRQKLCEIIASYGPSLSDDPRRCEGLLRDLCGQHRREIHVLVGALKEGVATELQSSASRGLPQHVVFTRLAKKLQDNLGLADEAAQWAVASWALALGLLKASDLTRPTQRRATTARTQKQTPPASKIRRKSQASSTQGKQHHVHDARATQQKNGAEVLPPPQRRNDSPQTSSISPNSSMTDSPDSSDSSAENGSSAAVWIALAILVVGVVFFFTSRDTGKKNIERKSFEEILATPSSGPAWPEFQGFPEDNTQHRPIQDDQDLAEALAEVFEQEVLPEVQQQLREDRRRRGAQ